MMDSSRSKWFRRRFGPSRRGVGALAAVLLLVVASSCARHYGRVPAVGVAPLADGPTSVTYLIGDFGRPSNAFNDLVGVIATEVAGLEAQRLASSPMILELGDNLYESGLPRDLAAAGASVEIDKLKAIASGFAAVRYQDAQVPLVLIPGNHDYNDNALAGEGNLGDISRWYFLQEMGIEGADAWTQVPGSAGDFAGSEALFQHLDGDPAARVDFMAATDVPFTAPDIGIVAADSELVIDLYAEGYEDLAAQYWQQVEAALVALPPDAWSMVATHHPPVTYGKHGRPALGNWVFGQGWPQFPKTWQKVLAVATPAAIALGIVVSPAALALAAVSPITTAVVSGRKQDLGSDAYDRYASELLRIADDHDVAVILAGHDHNTQIIELAGVAGFDDDTLLVVTGAGAKVDPVRRGPGTVAFLADYSFVRLSQYRDGLAFEIVDRRGETRYRHELSR